MTGNLALQYNAAFGPTTTGTDGVNVNITGAQTGSLQISSTSGNTNSFQLGNITIASGAGAFTLGGVSTTSYVAFRNTSGLQTFTNNSGNVATFGSNITYYSASAQARTLVFAGTGNWAVNSNLSVTGANISVTKQDAGTLTLAATNSYGGATTISAGTLQIGNGTDAGSIATTSSITNNGALVFNVAAGTRSYSKVISGTGSLTQNSSGGTLTLSGANTYTGATTVTAGTLVADTTTNATVLSSSSALAMNGGTFQLMGKASTDRSQIMKGLTVSAGASVVDVNNLGTSTTLDLRGSGSTLTINRTVGATVDFKATAGTLGTTALILPGTTNTNGILGAWATVNGGTDFAANSTNTAAGYVVAVTSTGGNLGDGGQATDSAMNFKPSGTQTDLTTAKSFNTLNLSGSIGATMTGSGAITVAGGGLIYNSTGTITGGTLAGSASGELVLHTPQALSLSSTAIVNNGGATALTKSGGSTLTLGATNTYSGTTTVAGGTLTLGASGSIASSPLISVKSGATLNVSAVSGGWTAQGSSSSNRQTLTGAGGVTGATTIGGFGTHNAGDGGVGSQAFSDNLTYASGSIFEWDLAGNTNSGPRNEVTTLSMSPAHSPLPRMRCSGSSRTPDWISTTTSGTAPALGPTSSARARPPAIGATPPFPFITSSGSLQDSSTQGSFTISGTSLTWTAVPEPTSALAGLLITAGLLRRRR